MSQKRKQINIEEKSRIISNLEKGIPNKDLAKEYGVSHSTISTIWKEREKIQILYDKNFLKMKRARTTRHTKIEEALLKWFKYQRTNNVPINGPILQQKANDFAQRFSEDFVCSSSWIQRFRARHGIVGGKMSGEAASVDKDVDKVENQDEDSNSSIKFSAEIWEQFETEDDKCRCCICREITDNTIEAMRNHLEESHPIVLIKILNKPTNTKSPPPIEECPTEADFPLPQSQNDDTESEMFTEVIYLDEALDTTSAQAVNNSSNEEIDSFLKYVGVLLRNMNKETQSKMQLDILDIILRKRQK